MYLRCNDGLISIVNLWLERPKDIELELDRRYRSLAYIKT